MLPNLLNHEMKVTFMLPIEHIMLEHKEDVEEYREKTQSKLGGIAEYWTPIVYEKETINEFIK